MNSINVTGNSANSLTCTRIFCLSTPMKHQDIKQLQCEVVNFKNWMDTYLLKLNVNKCKSVSYMVDVLNMPVNIQYVSDTVIDKVHKIKDLGIVFDCRLKFGEHIDEKK